MTVSRALADGFGDLVLGVACVGCGRGGRALCRPCADRLPREPALRWPSPTPPGLVPPWAMGDYADLLRALVLAHKEHRVLALARPLGDLLACSVVEARAGPGPPLVLVPVPSRSRAVRQRGHDPTLALTRAAARVLAGRDVPVVVARLLRVRPGVRDQAGLDARERASNLAGSMAVSSAAVRRLARAVPRAHLVLCDDVVTTGATLREAQRALEACGVPVHAAALVAATARRHSRKAEDANFG